MTMRVYIEHDVPRQGCATCLYITWDAERDEPALASPMTLQRVIMLEPRAGGTTQMSFVQRLPAYIPEWVIGLAMDSTFSRAILMVRAAVAARHASTLTQMPASAHTSPPYY